MHGDELDTLLRAWGLYYGDRNRPEAPRGERTASHPIARAQQFAPGKKDRRIAQGRAGGQRRRLMGRAAGIYCVPAEFVDPVPARETRSIHHQTERPVPIELQRVEQAVKDLEAVHLVRGLCLRAQYGTDGDATEKALWASLQFRKVKRDGEISVTQFKNELAFARVWISARLG